MRRVLFLMLVASAACGAFGSSDDDDASPGPPDGGTADAFVVDASNERRGPGPGDSDAGRDDPPCPKCERLTTVPGGVEIDCNAGVLFVRTKDDRLIRFTVENPLLRKDIIPAGSLLTDIVISSGEVIFSSSARGLVAKVALPNGDDAGVIARGLDQPWGVDVINNNVYVGTKNGVVKISATDTTTFSMNGPVTYVNANNGRLAAVRASEISVYQPPATTPVATLTDLGSLLGLTYSTLNDAGVTSVSFMAWSTSTGDIVSVEKEDGGSKKTIISDLQEPGGLCRMDGYLYFLHDNGRISRVRAP